MPIGTRCTFSLVLFLVAILAHCLPASAASYQREGQWLVKTRPYYVGTDQPGSLQLAGEAQAAREIMDRQTFEGDPANLRNWVHPSIEYVRERRFGEPWPPWQRVDLSTPTAADIDGARRGVPYIRHASTSRRLTDQEARALRLPK